MERRHEEELTKIKDDHDQLEAYVTHLTTNCTMILEESFNLEVPDRLPHTKPPRPGSDATKYCRYHHSIGHNTEDCWGLMDKIEELI